MSAFTAELSDAGGDTKQIALTEIVRIRRPNDMSLFAKCAAYGERIRELLLDDPRESNTEGRPFSRHLRHRHDGHVDEASFRSPSALLAAIYLREYAKDGFITRMVRIAVNNLAGVPSIVYGVYGLGSLRIRHRRQPGYPPFSRALADPYFRHRRHSLVQPDTGAAHRPR